MHNGIKIKEESLSTLLAEAEKIYPDECCGILFGEENEITGCKALPNNDTKNEREWHFSVDPILFYKTEMELSEKRKIILGFYHSHPDCSADLSEEDIEYMIPGMVYLIISLKASKIGEIKAYMKRTADGRVSELKEEFI